MLLEKKLNDINIVMEKIKADVTNGLLYPSLQANRLRPSHHTIIG
jgi:hypothetical protein